MKSNILKFLIAAFGLWFIVAETIAVEYNFSKSYTGKRRSVAVQDFGMMDQSFSQQHIVTSQNSTNVGLLSNQVTTSGSKSLMKMSSSLNNTSATGQVAGVVPVAAFSNRGANQLYEGFDNSGVGGSTVSINSIGGPSKLPGPGDFEPAFPPVGDGIGLLLLMAGVYAVVRRRI